MAPRDRESQIIRGNMRNHQKIRVLDDDEIVLLGSFSDLRPPTGERHNQTVCLCWWRVRVADLVIADASSQKILGVSVLSASKAKLVAVTIGAWGNKDTSSLISYEDFKSSPVPTPLVDDTQKNPWRLIFLEKDSFLHTKVISSYSTPLKGTIRAIHCVDDKILVANNVLNALDEFHAIAFPIEPTGHHIPCADRGFYVEHICTFQEGEEKRIFLVQTSCDPFGNCVFCYGGSRSADLLCRRRNQIFCLQSRRAAALAGGAIEKRPRSHFFHFHAVFGQNVIK